MENKSNEVESCNGETSSEKVATDVKTSPEKKLNEPATSTREDLVEELKSETKNSSESPTSSSESSALGSASEIKSSSEESSSPSENFAGPSTSSIENLNSTPPAENFHESFNLLAENSDDSRTSSSVGTESTKTMNVVIQVVGNIVQSLPYESDDCRSDSSSITPSPPNSSSIIPSSPNSMAISTSPESNSPTLSPELSTSPDSNSPTLSPDSSTSISTSPKANSPTLSPEPSIFPIDDLCEEATSIEKPNGTNDNFIVSRNDLTANHGTQNSSSISSLSIASPRSTVTDSGCSESEEMYNLNNNENDFYRPGSSEAECCPETGETNVDYLLDNDSRPESSGEPQRPLSSNMSISNYSDGSENAQANFSMKNLLIPLCSRWSATDFTDARLKKKPAVKDEQNSSYSTRSTALLEESPLKIGDKRRSLDTIDENRKIVCSRSLVDDVSDEAGDMTEDDASENDAAALPSKASINDLSDETGSKKEDTTEIDAAASHSKVSINDFADGTEIKKRDNTTEIDDPSISKISVDGSSDQSGHEKNKDNAPEVDALESFSKSSLFFDPAEEDSIVYGATTSLLSKAKATLKSISEPSAKKARSTRPNGGDDDDDGDDDHGDDKGEINENLCEICYLRPRDAIVHHRKSCCMVHCYECANRLLLANKRCPKCGSVVRNVTQGTYNEL